MAVPSSVFATVEIWGSTSVLPFGLLGSRTTRMYSVLDFNRAAAHYRGPGTSGTSANELSGNVMEEVTRTTDYRGEGRSE